MSTLRLTTIANQGNTASVPSETVINGSAKAWVNFNGTGTVAIRASFNVTSITDNGTGDYTINFTTAFADTEYSPVGGGAGDYSATRGCMITLERIAATGAESAKTTSALRVNSVNDAGTGFDCKSVNVAIFR